MCTFGLTDVNCWSWTASVAQTCRSRATGHSVLRSQSCSAQRFTNIAALAVKSGKSLHLFTSEFCSIVLAVSVLGARFSVVEFSVLNHSCSGTWGDPHFFVGNTLCVLGQSLVPGKIVFHFSLKTKTNILVSHQSVEIQTLNIYCLTFLRQYIYSPYWL